MPFGSLKFEAEKGNVTRSPAVVRLVRKGSDEMPNASRRSRPKEDVQPVHVQEARVANDRQRLSGALVHDEGIARALKGRGRDQVADTICDKILRHHRLAASQLRID